MFSADFAKVLNALQVIHEKLVSTRNTYQATEDANTARVNQVAGLTGGGAATGSGAAKGGTLSGTDGKGEANIAPNAPAATGAGGGLSGVGGLAQSLGSALGKGGSGMSEYTLAVFGTLEQGQADFQHRPQLRARRVGHPAHPDEGPMSTEEIMEVLRGLDPGSVAAAGASYDAAASSYLAALNDYLTEAAPALP